MKKFFQQYALAMVAVATIVTFSAFKATGIDVKQPRMTVAIFFHGDEEDNTQVEDESRWNTTPNGQTCDFNNQKACLQLVEHTDLTMLGTLNPALITLGSSFSGTGYIPTRTGGTSSTTFFAVNRT